MSRGLVTPISLQPSSALRMGVLRSMRWKSPWGRYLSPLTVTVPEMLIPFLLRIGPEQGIGVHHDGGGHVGPDARVADGQPALGPCHLQVGPGVRLLPPVAP